MTTLHTSRLRLEPCHPRHLDGLQAINGDPEVMKYLTGLPQTREETAEMIERVTSHWAEFGHSWWSFIELASGDIVGAGCIQNLRKDTARPDPACPLEVGWRLRRDRWHQGLASEAAVAMASFAFDVLDAERLYAVCNPLNVASEAVMRRLGMHYLGLQRWYALDVTTYEVTRHEWQQLRGAPSAARPAT